jgi:hypothetical protein
LFKTRQGRVVLLRNLVREVDKGGIYRAEGRGKGFEEFDGGDITVCPGVTHKVETYALI